VQPTGDRLLVMTDLGSVAWPRDELSRAIPSAPRRRPGLFVVDLGGAMIGTVTLDRRTPECRETAATDEEVQLGYTYRARPLHQVRR
jgi:hypothetical protein